MNLKNYYLPLSALLVFTSNIVALSQSRAVAAPDLLTVIDAQVISQRSGQTIGDLTHQDFVVKEDGVRQNILTMQREPRQLSILVLIDRSIHRRNRIQVDAMLMNFQSSLIQSLSEGDEVSVMAIADEPILNLDFTSHKGRISEVLASIVHSRNLEKTTRKTDYEAVFSEAAKQMRRVKKPLNRRVIIFVSAVSKSEVSAYNVPNQLVNLLLAPTSIFCWHNVFPIDLSLDELPRERVSGELRVTDLVGLTGGEMVSGDLIAVINRLRERYQIGYLPINPSQVGKLHWISLEISPSVKIDKSDLKIIYNRAYISSPRN
jgi:hypothetical protein